MKARSFYQTERQQQVMTQARLDECLCNNNKCDEWNDLTIKS